MNAFLLSLAGLVLAQAHSAWARPMLSEPPLGTGSAAFSGGGAAHAGGPNAVFANPATLAIPDGLEAEAGMMGLAGGVSPYFLYGARAGDHTSYAFGYYYDARVDPRTGGPARQGVIGGGSWEVDPDASLGLSVHSQGTGAGVGLDGFGVDVDAGALFRPRGALWAGLAARNLMESGVGMEPGGYRTRRSYLASIGLRTPMLEALGIRFHDPDAFYELRAGGFPPADFAHAFSLASSFTPGGKLGFRGTALIPHAGTPGFALGTFLNLPLGRAGIVAGYTFESGGGKDLIGERGPSHSISVNFRLGAKADGFPPWVEIRADKLVLAPDSTGSVQVFFHLSATDRTLAVKETEGDAGSDDGRPVITGEGAGSYGRQFQEGRIRDWELVLRAMGRDGKSGPEVKTFRGRDLPPRVIRWDGQDEAGQTVMPGFYAFRLSARDLAGNESVTAWQLLDLTDPNDLSAVSGESGTAGGSAP